MRKGSSAGRIYRQDRRGSLLPPAHSPWQPEFGIHSEVATMKKSWVIAILLGLVAASGSATATVIKPVSTVLTASAFSGGGTVTAEPVIVGAIYGQFSNSASSRNPDCDIGGSCDSAGASIFVSVEPSELSLRGWAGAGRGLGGYPYSGAGALVEFEVSTSSEWLLFVYGVDGGWWAPPSSRVELSDASGTVYFSDSVTVVFDVELGRRIIGDWHLTLDPGLYSLEARVGSGDYTTGQAQGDLQASLRPVPSVVPIAATFGTFGPDLLVFGLICLFVVLRPAWHRTRGTQPRLRAAQVASPAGWVGHRQQ